MFEQAKWIAKSADMGMVPAPLLRKSFTVKKGIKQAVLNVCGLGQGDYYINGTRVTDEVLITPITKYDVAVIYSTFTVTHLIKEGKNALGAILGNGWYNYASGGTWDYEKASWRHHPKLILQLDITYDDATQESICSGPDFKCQDSPIVYHESRCGECYDARMEIDGWCDADFDDSAWQNAFICRPPGGEVRNTEYAPIKIMNVYPAKKVSDNVYDIGINTSGWARIRARGAAGTKIRLRYSERFTPDGGVDTENINLFTKSTEYKHIDEYIMRGDGLEEWSPRFCYHGFRYVEVTGAPEEFSLEGCEVRAHLPVIGDFKCSDEMLNKIHMATRQATLTNFCSMPTDCPQREQNGWTGDASLSCEQALMNYDMTTAYMKWLQDILDVQRPSGPIPGIVPTAGWGFNAPNGPAWDSALVLIPYNIYKYTGDDSAIRLCWSGMKKYVDSLYQMSDNYIVGYGLWDWCPPKDVAVCSNRVTDTAYYYKFACVMAECAKLMGEDSGKYTELGRNIRKQFRARLIKDGVVEGGMQTAMACGIYQGLFNEDELPAAAAYLNDLIVKNGYHTDSGILGIKYVFRALSDNGYIETLYKMVTNPTYPSYAVWINSGLTALAEDWEMNESLNHHMFGEIDMWFYTYLAGIRPGDAGYKSVIIKPYFLEALDWVEANHNDIYVKWNKSEITVKSPVPATLILGDKTYKLSPGEHTVKR